MRRQRGQSAVEFALISPMIFLMILAAIYGGAMFIQFLNLSNQARTIARQIAVTSSSTKRQEMCAANSGVLMTADGKFAGFYKVTLYAREEPETDAAGNQTGTSNIVVTVNFDHGDFVLGFPPSEFHITYSMRTEYIDTSE